MRQNLTRSSRNQLSVESAPNHHSRMMGNPTEEINWSDVDAAPLGGIHLL
jgi:hypothetical protein